ncbi:MAG: glycogen/starch synthase [Alistipes sp.]|nr:glycogen/starch synthase [Alistipes sp.]MEE0864098.1 glycogen/starch synthase [Alistipes sp.]
MATNKILYVCQEISPYLPENELSKLSIEMARQMQERGQEVRTFMPRYGCINERRNQLHEVIRLSGMNLIINDNDHQLIIKVASIPSARIQIYFIDNDDYFSRRAVLHDADGKTFDDNDDRAIFFARGMLETVKKLRWAPTIVHCHGWFSAIAPMYLKKVFYDDPLFRDVKIVLSLAGDKFEGELASDFKQKLEGEGIMDSSMKILEQPSYENLYRFVIDYADGVIVTSPDADPTLVEYARSAGKKVLDYKEGDEKEIFDNYKRFYDEL